MAQTWLQLSIRAAKPEIELFSNFVFEKGSPGVVVRHGGVDAFFLSSRQDASLRREVQRFVARHSRQRLHVRKPRLEWKIVKQQDWEHSWKRFIRPGRVGKGFWVTPPWLEPPHFHRRRVITIEPGMAFGTGTHATTRSCLELLELVAGKIPQKKWRALDVGTGSGILAIALAILGAREILAIDNDPVALKVACENMRANRVTDKISLSASKVGAMRRKFTIVVANLTAETIIELAQQLQARVARQGYIIVSGILARQGPHVVRCFAKKFRLLKRRKKREWVSFAWQRI